MTMTKRWGLALASVLMMIGCGTSAQAQTPTTGKHTFKIGSEHFLLDGKKMVLRCGEIHPTRVPKEYWRHRLQLCKAMGLNTVSVYVFWNYHERENGTFAWEGQADLAEFCRIAQEEGLWVLLRPGPYVCSEWEMGGLPWWLLKHDDIALRSRDPRFMKEAREYIKEVGRVFGDLQVTRGGPILMVQVENEYGFYSDDAEYMGELRRVFLDAGFDVPLFACNPIWHLRRGHRDDLFPVVNFGSNPREAFRRLREIRKDGPLMSGEFYPGWFDTWGNPHHYGNLKQYLADIEYMLENDASFSIYMAHGGSTFGLWAGADRPFKPDTSSYDYDAPISEAGWTTKKFFAARELMSRYLLPGETIPEPAANNPVMTIDAFELTERAPVFENLPAGRQKSELKTYEQLDQAFGVVVYRTTLPAGPAGKLSVTAAHDFGWVLLGGEEVGVFDRRAQRYKVSVPARTEPTQLDILIYTMGRVNFGQQIHDRKGLHGPGVLTMGSREIELKRWEHFQLPMTAGMLDGLKYRPLSSSGSTEAAAFYRGTFSVDRAHDTFLNLRPWGKGIVWVNGRCIGRFWNIGPTQTMYIPGPWLNEGDNEIVIFDLIGPDEPVIAGLTEPNLNELRPEKNFGGSRRADVKLVLEGVKPAHEGAFKSGDQVQVVKFAKPVSGEFFCLESLNAFGNREFAGAAELDLIDARGRNIDRSTWTIAYVSSEERVGEDGTAENAIDGQTANFWHTQWDGAQPKHPHHLVIGLGKEETIAGFRYVPRPGGDVNAGGRIKDFRIYVGDGLVVPKQ